MPPVNAPHPALSFGKHSASEASSPQGQRLPSPAPPAQGHHFPAPVNSPARPDVYDLANRTSERLAKALGRE